MRILYVHGTSRVEACVKVLRKLNISTVVYPKRQTDAFLNEKEAEELFCYIKKHRITHMMSIHLIDTLAVAADRAQIIYISLIWDAPYHHVFSEYGRMKNCWFSTFDKVDAQRFLDQGLPHVLYQPLAVDSEAIRQWDEVARHSEVPEYIHDICFIGNLYEDNFYDEFCRNLPQVLKDYFTAVFENAAFCWDGINRIYGTVSNEMLDAIRKITPGFQMVNFFEIDDNTYFENGYLNRKLANIERICILNLLAEKYRVTLYTGSKTAENKLRNVKIMPAVSAGEDCHRVFKRSKINLNVSLKGIEGGTPQRVMDILGASGFAVTSYCAETAELFEEDKELVMFRSLEELVDKVDFYLNHDRSREKVAKAGYEKVMRCYTYENKMKNILAWLEKDGR